MPDEIQTHVSVVFFFFDCGAQSTSPNDDRGTGSPPNCGKQQVSGKNDELRERRFSPENGKLLPGADSPAVLVLPQIFTRLS